MALIDSMKYFTKCHGKRRETLSTLPGQLRSRSGVILEESEEDDEETNKRGMHG